MDSDLKILNISAYKFISLTDIDQLRAKLEGECEKAGLKGTVLLAPEGINCFLAGAPAAVDGVLNWLRSDARFADLKEKRSFSAQQPFKRLRIKRKREIITMNQPLIEPEKGRAPVVSPEQLQTWLTKGYDDEGRPVVMMETRNAFEVDYGTFKDCVDYRIAKFSEFPSVVSQHQPEFNGKTVVTFCTGGIRCEKAAIVMQQAGYERVYQLDGGILNYFEKVGGAHWDGECFVFDEREALDSTLKSLQLAA